MARTGIRKAAASILALSVACLLSASAVAQEGPASPTDTTQIDRTQLQQATGKPVKEKQFVYSLSPWTDTEYGGTFAPKNADKFFLMANVDNLVNSLETEVYYWPITMEFMADWFGLKKEIAGKLEVLQGGKVIKTFEKTDYVYRYEQGMFGPGVKLITGEQSRKEFKAYQDATNAFYEAIARFNDEQIEYQRKLSELLERVNKTKKFAKPEEIPTAPVQPTPPALYVSEPEQSFVVNLPVGEYKLRLVDEKGNVVANSEKKLQTFTWRREGIGYQIIPEVKWTVPVTSDDPTEVLYLQGKRTFYLEGFREREYNRYLYTRMTELHKPLEGQGTSGGWQWVHTAPVDKSKLQILKDGKVVQTIEKKPFYVQQTPGYALGYEIIEFDSKKPEFQGTQPTFEAYRVQLDAGGTYVVRFVDAQGKVVPGSERVIRSIKTSGGWPLYVIPLFPLVLGLILFVSRRRLSLSARRLPGVPEQVGA